MEDTSIFIESTVSAVLNFVEFYIGAGFLSTFFVQKSHTPSEESAIENCIQETNITTAF